MGDELRIFSSALRQVNVVSHFIDGIRRITRKACHYEYTRSVNEKRHVIFFKLNLAEDSCFWRT